jgi:hypothetical protein
MEDLIKIGVSLTIFCAWLTSIVACIQHSMWALLFVDIFVPPVAVIHGIGLWFGAF